MSGGIERLAKDEAFSGRLVNDDKCADLNGGEKGENDWPGDGDAVVPCEIAEPAAEVGCDLGDGLEKGAGQAGTGPRGSHIDELLV